MDAWVFCCPLGGTDLMQEKAADLIATTPHDWIVKSGQQASTFD
jgi:hypothetical protein